MAPTKRKKGFSIKFDLSITGLLGVGVVCFCIFLWMFLLGIWAGQTVLDGGEFKETAGAMKTPEQSPPSAAEKPGVPAEKAVPHPQAGKKVKTAAPKKEAVKPGKAAPAKEEEEPEEDPSFFAVQVGAFKDKSLAEKSVTKWQGKGYAVFSRPPEGNDDKFTRVYIGRFDSMAAAKEQAGTLEKKEKIKSFIALVPAD